MNQVNVQKMTCARIPTDVGEFQLCYYKNSLDDKEHLALIMGEVTAVADVLVRVHSECFTGDVVGSRRCDCGPQLSSAMRLIAERGHGVIIYLRQEGRGIGLLDKLRAYNLQDVGYDTVDANLMLGHQADERDYTIAARILEDLGIQSLQLLTNNPAKIDSLRQLGFNVVGRVPLITEVNSHNADYLKTKVQRMRHLLDVTPVANGHAVANGRLPSKAPARVPQVTLSYAQSLDGSITARRGQPTAISGDQSMVMTHQLRGQHDAILVGIGTVLADNPRLTVRLATAQNPQPIVLDTHLRLPLTAKLLSHPTHTPWIFASEAASAARHQRLTAAGARIFVLPLANGRLDLPALLAALAALGVQRLMVEGGATVIGSFLQARLVDRVVLTIAPRFIGGLNALDGVNGNGRLLPHLHNVTQTWVGADMVVRGDVVWDEGGK